MRSLALVVWLVCVVSLVCGQSVPLLRESPLLKGSVINDAERQPTAIPGTQFTHWAFPTEAQIDYLQSRGATLVRVPINIGRLLPTLDGQLDATQVNAIENLLRYTASRSLNVIIAPHGNGDAQMYDSVSATYKKIGSGSDQISSATFARFWGLLAARFRKFPTVMFALLDTPTSPTPAAWASIAQDAVNAIRATGATQRIFVSGTASSWANAWVSSGNGAALAGLQDSANNLMYDVRIFLGSTGTSQTSTCASSMGGATAIGASTTWAVQQGKRMLLTLKWANNANCQSVASSLFSYMRSNANAWVGYAYGEMGLSYWHSSTTAYNIQPADFKESTAVPVQVDTMLYDWQQSGLMPFVPTPYTSGQKWKGVNMGGFETNRGNPNGVLNTDFIAPTEREIAYFAAAGMNIVRFPLAGARLQPVLYQPLNNNNLNLIKSTLALCQQYNMQLLLDPHDYGSMYDSVRGGGGLINVAGGVEISAFTDFWTRVATAFLSYPATAVSFGLMNEPNEQNAWQWRDAAVAAMAAIRATGATNKIFIPGTSYTGGHNWVDVGNAAAWTGITDPANNFVFEIHQYLDQYYSGVNSNCPTNGARILADATSWARRNGYQLFVGEVGWSTSSDCTTQGQAILDFMHANADVFLGYAYWASGRWWSADYAFSVQPAGVNTAGATPTDKLQMAALRADVARTPPPQV